MSRRMEWSGIGIIIPVLTMGIHVSLLRCLIEHIEYETTFPPHRAPMAVATTHCTPHCTHGQTSPLRHWLVLLHTLRYAEPWCSPLAERSSCSTACSRRQTRTRTLTRSRSRRRKARRRLQVVEVDALSGGAISGGAIKDVVCCLQQQGTKMRLLKQHPDGLWAALQT